MDAISVPGPGKQEQNIAFKSLHLLFNLLQIPPAIVRALSKQRLKKARYTWGIWDYLCPPLDLQLHCYLALIWPLFVKNMKEKPQNYVKQPLVSIFATSLLRPGPLLKVQWESEPKPNECMKLFIISSPDKTSPHWLSEK